VAGLSYGEALALLLIHRGVDSVGGLSRALGVSREEAEEIVRGLESRGLVRVERGLLGGRIRLTRAGLDALPEAARVVGEVRGALVGAAERARAGEPVDVDAGLLALAPALAFLGLLPAWALGVLLGAGFDADLEEGAAPDDVDLDLDF